MTAFFEFQGIRLVLETCPNCHCEYAIPHGLYDRVQFVQQCGQCCWHWLMPNGDKIMHWERSTYERIKGDAADDADLKCPDCGNPNVRGGTIKEPKS